jgi:hypothetical protein
MRLILGSWGSLMGRIRRCNSDVDFNQIPVHSKKPYFCSNGTFVWLENDGRLSTGLQKVSLLRFWMVVTLPWIVVWVSP